MPGSLHKFFICFVVLLPLLLGACGSRSPHKPSPLLSIDRQTDLDRVWSTFLSANDTHQFHIFEPLLDGDDIYITVQNGYLYKFSLAEDRIREIYQVNLGQEIYSGASMHEDLIYVCVDGEQLVGLSVENGDPVVEVDLSSHCVAPPLFDGGRIYLRLADGSVIAHNGEQEVLWSFSQGLVNLSLDGNSPLLLYNDSLFFGADTSKLHSLSPDKGELYWSVNVGVPQSYTEIGLILDIDAPIEVWGNYLIVSAYQGRILMVNSLTGRQLWDLTLSTRTGVAIDGQSEQGWVSDNEGVIHNIDLSSGRILWSSDVLKYRTLSKPALVGEALVIADRFGYLHTFATADGQYLGRKRMEVAFTHRDSRKKRYIRGRYVRKHKQTHLFSVRDDLFISQDLSGRLVFYQIENLSP